MGSTENTESKPDRSLLLFSARRAGPGTPNASASVDAMTHRAGDVGSRAGPLSRSAGRGPGTGRVQGRAGAEPALVWEPDLERGAGGGRRGRRGGPRWPRTLLLVSGRRPPPPALAAPSPRPAPAAAHLGRAHLGRGARRSHLGQDEGPAGAAEGREFAAPGDLERLGAAEIRRQEERRGRGASLSPSSRPQGCSAS